MISNIAMPSPATSTFPIFYFAGQPSKRPLDAAMAEILADITWNQSSAAYLAIQSGASALDALRLNVRTTKGAPIACFN